MTDVLDELRDDFRRLMKCGPYNPVEVVDAFAERHPGLADFTTACAECGRPMNGFTAEDWMRPVCPTCAEKGEDDG